METRKCEWCRKSFVGKNREGKPPRFCSKQCFALSEKARRKIYKCEHCHQPFEKRTHGVIPRFCSGECWYASQREKSHNTNPIYTCKHCGETFARRYKAAKVPQFCSPKCSNQARRSLRQVHICRGCGKEFTKSRSDQAGAFCSRRCFIENKKTRKRTYKCAQCETDFTRVTWPGNSPPKYCSQDCAFKGHKGEKNKKHNKPTRYCKLCGTQIDWGNVAFCSQQCANRHAYENGQLDYRVRGFVVTIKRKGKLRCERCGNEALHHLTVHHRDENTRNNSDENLETLCSNCHFEIHWADTPSRNRNLKKALEIAAYIPVKQIKEEENHRPGQQL